MGERYRSAFTAAQLVAADKAVTAGEWARLGVYAVQAGEMISLGYGALSGMDNAVGRIYAKFAASGGAEVTGKVRLTIYSPQDRPLKIMHEFRTEALNTSASDRTKQTPFAEGPEIITEDKKIVLEFLPDANATIAKAQSVLIMDITQGVV